MTYNISRSDIAATLVEAYFQLSNDIEKLRFDLNLHSLEGRHASTMLNNFFKKDYEEQEAELDVIIAMQIEYEAKYQIKNDIFYELWHYRDVVPDLLDREWGLARPIYLGISVDKKHILESKDPPDTGTSISIVNWPY